MREIPGDSKFDGEVAFDIGQRVQFNGKAYSVGGIARTATGFLYLLRVPGSRALASERKLTRA